MEGFKNLKIIEEDRPVKADSNLSLIDLSGKRLVSLYQEVFEKKEIEKEKEMIDTSSPKELNIVEKLIRGQKFKRDSEKMKSQMVEYVKEFD